jgi:hypothetical protein
MSCPYCGETWTECACCDFCGAEGCMGECEDEADAPFAYGDPDVDTRGAP